jgi:hypothetical protein
MSLKEHHDQTVPGKKKIKFSMSSVVDKEPVDSWWGSEGRTNLTTQGTFLLLLP